MSNFRGGWEFKFKYYLNREKIGETEASEERTNEQKE